MVRMALGEEGSWQTTNKETKDTHGEGDTRPRQEDDVAAWKNVS